MTTTRKRISVLLFLVLIAAAGCATVPTGPSVAVMPAPGKPFDLFQAEDISCRQWAEQQTGTSPQEALNENTATGAVVGGIVGTGIGALFSGGRGSGAAFGAATGTLFGASAGAESGRYSAYEAQRRYDVAYQQCMYSNGNMAPGVRYYRTTQPPPPPDLSAEPGLVPRPPVK